MRSAHRRFDRSACARYAWNHAARMKADATRHGKTCRFRVTFTVRRVASTAHAPRKTTPSPATLQLLRTLARRADPRGPVYTRRAQPHAERHARDMPATCPRYGLDMAAHRCILIAVDLG
ncbi:hypothetical protein D7S86_14390 [Pararobbsia silviterrae]|uniref:Uncharacterized protein n=1 Tax=Pararobbsia silviterrae TaxID=1792498 RepID=A0A494Y0I1_9BURK|nr:hypothetical protein D7S86_14390 [Pararobbsia silviterrae]